MANPYTTAAKVNAITNIPVGEVEEDWITWASAEIDSYTGETFGEAATFTDERHDGDGTRILRPHNTPIVSVTSISFYNSTLTSTTYYTYDNYVMLKRDYSDPMLATLLQESGEFVFPIGNGNIYITYVGGYSAVPSKIELCATLMVAEIAKMAQRKGVDQSMVYNAPEEQVGRRSRFLYQGVPEAWDDIMDRILKGKRRLLFR